MKGRFKKNEDTAVFKYSIQKIKTRMGTTAFLRVDKTIVASGRKFFYFTF